MYHKMLKLRSRIRLFGGRTLPISKWPVGSISYLIKKPGVKKVLLLKQDIAIYMIH